jgi:pimeloyl-ACP methyl ester carboxylesterase
MRTSLFAALLVGLLGCTSKPAPSRTLALSPCRLPGVDGRLRCGTFDVFEDRAAKTGRKLSLHVAVMPALAPSPAPDPVFILAGGPGQAASEIAPILAAAFSRVNRDRDLVFVDQRGTGRSHKLECEPDATPSLNEALHPDLNEADILECLKSLDADPRLYTTPIAMDDLDDVRAALGYPRINLWGGSYGTRAALVYARRHPDHLRAMVLDGVAPMSLYLPLDMAKDADRALRLLFADCRAQKSCDQAWPTLQPRFEALLEKLEHTPAQVTLPDPRTGAPTPLTIDRATFVRSLRGLLYDPTASTLIPLTIDRAIQGDFRPFAAEAEATNMGIATGLLLSVVCTEDLPFTPLAKLEAASKGTFGGMAVAQMFLDGCAHWPKGTLPDGYREPVRSEAPTLLLSGTLDPVTPPRWAKEAAKTLPHSLSETVPATGHGTLAHACVRDLIEQFYQRGSVEGLASPCAADTTRPPFLINFAGPPP